MTSMLITAVVVIGLQINTGLAGQINMGQAAFMGVGAYFELWDSALHRGIAEAAGNRLMLDIFEMLDAIRLDPVWRDLPGRRRR